jgi:alpha-ribazole phosphatase
MGLGDFEGRTFQELRSDPDFSRWIADSRKYSPPGGEETAEFAKRVVLALGDIFHEMMDSRMTSVAVVTHGGVIMSALSAIGLPRLSIDQWAVGNGEGFTLLLTPQMWMRDNAVEVFARLPMERTEDNISLYGDPYEDEEE